MKNHPPPSNIMGTNFVIIRLYDIIVSSAYQMFSNSGVVYFPAPRSVDFLCELLSTILFSRRFKSNC